MPGIATQFVVLERTIDKLGASGNPMLEGIAQLMKVNSAFAYLGAVGPSLAGFIPADPPVGTGPSTPASPYASLWGIVLGIAGGDGTPTDPGILYVINEFKRLLDKIEGIVVAQDLGALKDLRDSGEVAVIEQVADQLKVIVDGMLPRVAGIGAAITTAMKPAVNVAPGSPPPPPQAWSAREWMFWKHPGRFAQSLVSRAQASGDPRFLAYAYGYLSSFSGCASINPFLNSVVGSGHRQQWWRTRWVGNYADTWVHGFYARPTVMAGDTPNPPYPQWTGLCDAALHDRISLGSIDPVAVMTGLRQSAAFPSVLPADFSKFWMSAWEDAYGPPPLTSRFRAGALNGAYVMTWMKLWFQTSGLVVGCPAKSLGAPPSTCGSAPPWVDPNVPGDNGSGTGPKVPEPESDPDIGEIISGAILAILGVASFIFGGAAIGAALLAAGVGLMVDGAIQIDWDKLACDIFWLRMYLNNGLKALHDLLTLGGFTHPYPSELALDTTTITLLGIPYTFDSGKRLAKSRPLFPKELTGALHREPVGSYPTKAWDGGLGTWTQTPTASSPGVEAPETAAYLVAEYLSFAVADDIGNPLSSTSDVRTGTSWPPGERHLPGTLVPVTFANAVDNAVDLIGAAGSAVPDWNLDGDRGMAWLTWQHVGPTISDPMAVAGES